MHLQRANKILLSGGINALGSLTTGTGNIGIGLNTMYLNTSGNNNVVIGGQSGYYITGSNNVVIGSGIQVVAPAANNQLNIGNWIYGNNGLIGINTTDTKGYQFAVNGSAIATKMVVKLNSNWADFVFKPAYDLPKLESVAQFINKNGHLPNIPTEQEVQKDGIDLGSMNTKLLQKVEELTLYLIEMKREMDKLKREMAELKKGK